MPSFLFILTWLLGLFCWDTKVIVLQTKLLVPSITCENTNLCFLQTISSCYFWMLI